MTTRLPAALLACLLFVGLMSALFVVGCDGDDGGEAPPANGGTVGKTPDEAPLPEWHGEMTVEAMNWDELQQLIADQQGKPVVVQLWATWSGASRNGLRELVELQKRLGTDVVAIAVNTNAFLEAQNEGTPPEQAVEAAKAKVRPILEEYDARFRNVISTVPDEMLYEKLGVPSFAVIVYDPSGQVAQRFQHSLEPLEKDPFTYDEDVVPLVKKLIGK